MGLVSSPARVSSWEAVCSSRGDLQTTGSEAVKRWLIVRHVVVVGTGILSADEGWPGDALSLMDKVVEQTGHGSLAGILARLDAIAVLRGFWRYQGVGSQLAARFGAAPRLRLLAPPCGSHAELLLNTLARRISLGELDSALLVAGETTFSDGRRRKLGVTVRCWGQSRRGRGSP